MEKTRQIIHVDMDAFYASVEQLDNPKLANRPVIVGGSVNKRGVVAAASYKARAFGVHSAMPMARAIKLCPDAIVLPVRMARYTEISKQIHAVFEKYTPIIEPVSLDEAFLDVTGSINLFGNAEKIGRQIKMTIKRQLKLTASVGIAPNKFLAKLASDLEKPDGFVIITEQSKQAVLDRLSVGKIWGVGKVTQKKLAQRGIKTIVQLRKSSEEQLRQIVGNFARQLLQLSVGCDNRPVLLPAQQKSISTEYTFPTDTKNKEILLNTLLNQTEKIAQRLRQNNLKTQTVTLKLRYSNFKTITKSKTIPKSTDSTQMLWLASKDIFENWFEKSGQPLRLIGFEVCRLISTENCGDQLMLFNDKNTQKQKRLDQAIDKIKERFGQDILKRQY